MQAARAPVAVMTSEEVSRVHHNALRILREIGMEIQNTSLLRVLADFGLPVDFDQQRARFPTPLVERFLAEAEPFDWQQVEPHIGASAGVYHGRFHEPESGALVDWSEDRLAYYFALAGSLEHVEGAQMLGCRLPAGAPLEPLYERYYCWKYGAREGSSIYLDETCPYLYDLYQLRADALGKPLPDVFRGTVYLIPALKLGQHEAYQVAYFRERGLRVGIGDMLALGANAPMTLAGAVTLNLAEQLALRILDWAWFGIQRLHISVSISPMDMRTMIYPYGRPDMALGNLMTAQMARYYGASCSGHAGLSDAKLPSVEAGYQKALTALPTLLATGALWYDAGLLSIDEVCSPIQLVLDNEFLSALKHFIHPMPVDDAAIGFDTILAAGPGGQYLDKDHTVRYLRASHWQPKIWSREMLAPWLDGSRAIDADRAREVALAVRKTDYRASQLSPEFERDFAALVASARENLAV